MFCPNPKEAMLIRSPKGASNPNCLHKSTFTEVMIFTTGKVQKQPKCQSTDKWIKKPMSYALDCYSAIKKKKRVLFVA